MCGPDHLHFWILPYNPFFWWHIYHFLQVYLDKANKQSFQIVFHMFRNIRPPYRGRAKVVGYSDLWIVPSNRRRFLYVCPLVHLAGVIKRKRKKIDFMWYIICHELPLYTRGMFCDMNYISKFSFMNCASKFLILIVFLSIFTAVFGRVG